MNDNLLNVEIDSVEHFHGTERYVQVSDADQRIVLHEIFLDAKPAPLALG